jgi:type IV pilus assembly protein PilQ
MMFEGIGHGRAESVIATVTGLAAILLACASAPQTTSPSASESMQLSEVRVERAADGTVVGLMGLSEPVYTAFRQDDPERVIVDLEAVRPAAGSVPVVSGDGLVQEVALTPFAGPGGEDRLRVELLLSGEASHEVVALADRLEVRVRPGSAATTAGDGAWSAPTPDVAAAPASVLLGVKASSEEETTVVELRGDGRIGVAEPFVLDDPARLVIDLPGIGNRSAAPSLEVGSAQVSRVRVAQHDGKVRVVLDGASAAAKFASWELAPTAEGLAVAVGPAAQQVAARRAAPAAGGDALPASPAFEPLPESAPEMAETAEATQPIEVAAAGTPEPAPVSENAPAPEPQPQAAVEPEPTQTAEPAASPAPEPAKPAAPLAATQVFGVQYDSQPERDRVTISTDGTARFRVVETDSQTVVVRLLDAAIPPEASVQLAPDQGGPVSMVHAFQQPESTTPEVRVVIRRAAGVTPQPTQQGSVLFLDFARGAQAASPVPMNSAGQAELAAAGASGKAVAGATADATSATPPAAIGPVEGSDILAEGGLINGKKYAGRRVSLDFKDVEIGDVLRLIAEVSDLNIIAGDEVKGEVTIRLVDVPWDQALDVILLTKGLGFVRVGNVLRIAPSEVLKTEEEARLQERRAKEKLEDLVVKLQPVNYANVTELKQMVERLLTPRGTVDVDKRTNTLIIKDISSVIDESTALIKAIDTQTPQVLIEAKVVEAKLDFSREVGSVWAFGAQPLEDGFDSSSDQRRDLGGEDFAFHDNALYDPFSDGFNHVSVANPITSVANGLLDLGAFLLDETFNVELQLQAAESSGEGKVISSPRIVTLDNRKATIEQGVSIPFQTFENGDAKLEFIDAVLKLEVTPHITADRSIIMKIEVQRNAPDDSVPTPTGSPAIAKNEAETETLVKDGQTLVIGGIYVVQKSQRGSAVPYFNKIPILGNAFENNEDRDIRQELLVFVTPRIVVNPEGGA